MNKLQIFWKSRNTWVYDFYNWYELMYPHIKYGRRWVYDKLDEEADAYWFWEGLNNYDNVNDGEDL